MLNQETADKLIQMRLRGMAEALREQQERADAQLLSFEERLGMRGRHRYRVPRGLDRQLVRSLTAEPSWVRDRQNLFITGATGVGKTWLARAFAHKACRDGYTALFVKALELFRNLATARADGSHSKTPHQLAKVDLLVVDDWAMAPMSDPERRDFLEISDERYQNRATLLTRQMPVKLWHNQIGDPTLADSILDRLVHNADRIDLTGESIRKECA